MMNGGGYGLQQRNFDDAGTRRRHVSLRNRGDRAIAGPQGRVIGVRALTPQGFATFHAKSVVLACGRFEANPEMRARYLGPGWDMVHSARRAVQHRRRAAHGAGHRRDAARQLDHLPRLAAGHRDGRFHRCRQRTQWAHRLWMRPIATCIRIRSWSTPTASASSTKPKTRAARPTPRWAARFCAQPGGVAFQILDAKMRKSIMYPSNYDKATTAKADTLEKLAEELDINVANLVKTVREFNAAVQPGDIQSGPPEARRQRHRRASILRKSNYALTIDEPPFEAWPVRCGITFTFGGLKIDPKTAQVQHVAGRPIPGLYAAGEMVGGLLVGNYASGSGMMAGAMFGRIAGTHAARQR